MSDRPETRLAQALDAVQREQASQLAEARRRREERQRAFELWATGSPVRDISATEARLLNTLQTTEHDIESLRVEIEQSKDALQSLLHGSDAASDDSKAAARSGSSRRVTRQRRATTAGNRA
ncbi:hypothetical protein [Bradyrhizobium guangxiense]|uniref:hypothetical protein n=1 Tax=Bradyrhizobium guangxiense TaxID=1325115 RepID=UPI0010088324|nr:hypothetical protein [Bradyrhizobium guangxiense]